MKSLEGIYEELKNPIVYKKAVKKRIAKIVLGASVIRAFEENTKPDLFTCLIGLEIDSLSHIQTEEEFDKWHAQKITAVYNCLLKTNQDKFADSLEGLKWGHATKVFNLYIGHLYHYSPYFEDEKRKMKANRFLHIPLDSKVFAALHQFNIPVPKSIKSITAAQYKKIQNELRSAAYNKKVDPLRFDDYAWAETD